MRILNNHRAPSPPSPLSPREPPPPQKKNPNEQNLDASPKGPDFQNWVPAANTLQNFESYSMANLCNRNLCSVMQQLSVLAQNEESNEPVPHAKHSVALKG